MNHSQIKRFIQRASDQFLMRDNPCSSFLSEKDRPLTASLSSQSSCYLYGVNFLEQCFKYMNPQGKIEKHTKDGNFIKAGEKVLSFSARPQEVLEFKQLALYILSKLSSIADLSYRYKFSLANSKSVLSEPRFYNPHFSFLEKEAVLMMGAHIHKRFFRKDIRIEKEHIDLQGSLTPLVNTLVEALSPTVKIEVFPRNLEEVNEASRLGVDLIVLKDFSFSEIKMAQNINRRNSYLEITGDLELEETKKLGELKIDFISSDLMIKKAGFLPFSFQLERSSL